MVKSRESEIAERFLDRADEESFTALFRVFWPQVLAFFRKRGHDMSIAEDLAQEVMLIVYRKARQIRDYRLFRAWIFRVARHAAYRHLAQRSRQAPMVDLTDIREPVALPHPTVDGGSAFEFKSLMRLLEPHEREAMTLRFVEEWEYHEIADAQAVPIGTVQWRVFNSKKKLAGHLGVRQDSVRKAA